MDNRLGLGIHHFDQHFDGGLKPPGHAGGDPTRRQNHQENAQRAHADRPKQGVEIENRPIDDSDLLVAGAGEMSQVVDDVLARCGCMLDTGTRCHDQFFNRNANRFACKATNSPPSIASQ
jgi:hypothetical protein